MDGSSTTKSKVSDLSPNKGTNPGTGILVCPVGSLTAPLFKEMFLLACNIEESENTSIGLNKVASQPCPPPQVAVTTPISGISICLGVRKYHAYPLISGFSVAYNMVGEHGSSG